MMKRLIPVLLVCLICGQVTFAAETAESNTNWRIRQEITENSQIMNFVHYLTDMFGPRLTGSPNFKAACEWAIEQMKKWGMKNEHLETWDFRYPGWACDKNVVRVVSPYKDTLSAKVVAWTPSTAGVVRAKIVQITPSERASQERLETYLNSLKDTIRDRIVLVGAPVSIPIAFNPPVKRRDESELRTQYDPNNPPPARPQQAPEAPTNGPKPMEPREMEERIDAFLLSSGALAKVTDAGRTHGQIRVFANRAYNTSKTVPSIVVRNEDYGRMSRVLADGIPVEMEIEIVNTIYPDGRTSYNAIAEFPGTDKKDQIVMMGSHIDSWHAGTGATDNATGVAVMMEAARILQKLGVQPRRTIRVALWGGEEQGLLGSKAYVKDHFGTFEAPGAEFSGLDAYVNLDSGTGRVRGASIFGPPEAAAILKQILQPFMDLGVVGATSISERKHGGTDSTSFNWAGLAGINLSQDPIEYTTDSWHTNLDTYERVLEEDLKQCAIVVAAIVYHLSMREEMLPRFTGEKMPKAEKQ